MTPAQMVAIVLGIFMVLLMVLTWTLLDKSAEWTLVAQGVAGAIIAVAVFAVILGGIFAWIVKKK